MILFPTTEARTALLIVSRRFKKYYRSWRVPYSLDDAQTLSRSEPNPYERWNEEWKESNIPKELQPFDITFLPGYLKARSRPSTSFFAVRSLSETTLDYRRKLFGRYGLASGVDPSSLLFDSRSVEFEKLIESQNEKPVDEVLNQRKTEKAAERQKTEELMRTIQKNMQKMPEYIEKHLTQKLKQSRQNELQAAKQKRIMEEARDRFGYYLSPHDPKFKKLREEIEEREKLERKRSKGK
ncbi:unnamed protein product [Calicophoron daubneyi]|uniref:Large ribosomal subunit protein mL64 n=1 Tax=Calicophoron daubneyi TaxID=300641 RepID=A0AAV2U1X2_CALDB